MPGIYIHIPFCKKKCSYCNFFSISAMKYKGAFLKALIKEIEIRKYYLNNNSIDTLYFGGGTPSLLTTDEIELIIYEINKSYRLADKTEITIELNPESTNLEYLKKLKDLGFNRLSIGIQSFFDEDLIYLERIHNEVQAEKAIKDSITAGFTNISADIIYAIPVSDDWKLINNLEKINAYGINHFSAYSLSVESGTNLYNQIKNGTKKAVDEETSLRQFELIMNFAAKNGYEHYEISNFCKNAKYSIHNSAYWKGTHYLGLGPSAHSYNGNSRQWNITDVLQYISGAEKGTVFYESEELSTDQKYNEYILTSLRTKWGCSEEFIHNNFGNNYLQYFQKVIEQQLNLALVFKENNCYCLTMKGKFLADHITRELFI